MDINKDTAAKRTRKMDQSLTEMNHMASEKFKNFQSTHRAYSSKPTNIRLSTKKK
jgi:hypothetical protein